MFAKRAEKKYVRIAHQCHAQHEPLTQTLGQLAPFLSGAFGKSKLFEQASGILSPPLFGQTVQLGHSISTQK